MPTFSNANANSKTSAGFGKLLEPGLRKIFFETYDEVPEQYSQVFNVLTSDKHAEHDYGMGAFGDWAKRTDEYSEVAYEAMKAGSEITYVHDEFTKGFAVSRALVDDEMYNVINKYPKALARAGRAKVEKDCATFLGKTAFETLIFGGAKEPLFATAHTLINSSKKNCNLVTGALTDATLKDACTMLRKTYDEAGNLVGMKPKKLIVAPGLEYTAKAILNSTQVAGGQLNDKNTLPTLELMVYDWLGEVAGAEKAWFVMDTDQHELNFFWRVKFEFKNEEAFDTLVSKYRGYCRYSLGASDYRGIVGSKGVTA